MKPIITSLLDQDFYKLTINQAIEFSRLRNLYATYMFFDRGNRIDNCGSVSLIETLKMEVKYQIEQLNKLKFTKKELIYLRTLNLFQEEYIKFLSNFKFNTKKEIYFKDNGFGKFFDIIADGPITTVMMYEIFVLAIVNECYFRKIKGADTKIGINSAKELITSIKSPVAEFGTRRRYSKEHHWKIYDTLVKQGCKNLLGTSNIELSMAYGTRPIGTVAHEFIEAFEAVSPISWANYDAMIQWKATYGDKLNIFLPDTLTTNFFLETERNVGLIKDLDGLRHDSSSPYEFTDKVTKWHKKHKIDPMTKTIVFSDSLNTAYALAIEKFCKNKIKCSFGIGTYLTNNVGLTPLNIVMKMIRCDGKPVAKLSDNPEKAICTDPIFLNHCKKLIGEQK